MEGRQGWIFLLRTFSLAAERQKGMRGAGVGRSVGKLLLVPADTMWA